MMPASGTGSCTTVEEPVQYWEGRWASRQTGWHKKEPDLANLDLIVPDDLRGRVFVPLCGASPDLLWFAKQPNVTEVIGIEAADTAIQMFLAENPLDFQVETATKRTEDAETKSCRVVSFPANKLKIYQCDFFDALEYLGADSFDFVYDRASFVAIEPSRRETYLDIGTRLLRATGSYYLVTVCYEEGGHAGPPRRISCEDVNKYFGGRMATVEARVEKRTLGKMFKEQVEVTEDLYRMTALPASASK